MTPSIWLGVLLVTLLLNTAISIRVVRWDALTTAQRSAWVLFVWLIPVLGAFLALQITSESTRKTRTEQSSGVGIGDPVDIGLGTNGVTSLDGAHHGSERGHGGDGGSFGDGGGDGGH